MVCRCPDADSIRLDRRGCCRAFHGRSSGFGHSCVAEHVESSLTFKVFRIACRGPVSFFESSVLACETNGREQGLLIAIVSIELSFFLFSRLLGLCLALLDRWC